MSLEDYSLIFLPMASLKGQGRSVLPELGVTETIATAANAVYTAQIAQDATPVKVVTVTVTTDATDYLVLPKATAELIGRVIYIANGATGYELVTPDASGDTINAVDADGTNQLDCAASTVQMCIQTTATGWRVVSIAATTVTVVAPDND